MGAGRGDRRRVGGAGEGDEAFAGERLDFEPQRREVMHLDEREGGPMGSVLTFVNAVADEVAKHHPDVKVGTLAYQRTRKPPKLLRPRLAWRRWWRLGPSMAGNA